MGYPVFMGILREDNSGKHWYQAGNMPGRLKKGSDPTESFFLVSFSLHPLRYVSAPAPVRPTWGMHGIPCYFPSLPLPSISHGRLPDCGCLQAAERHRARYSLGS